MIIINHHSTIANSNMTGKNPAFRSRHICWSTNKYLSRLLMLASQAALTTHHLRTGP